MGEFDLEGAMGDFGAAVDAIGDAGESFSAAYADLEIFLSEADHVVD